jgi:hypothetical protein
MKDIQPIQIWVNGEYKNANCLSAYIINDNLVDNAMLCYILIKSETVGDSVVNTTLTNGNVSIYGEEYANWGDSGNVNEEAYNIVASKLNLTLINS